ncbi:PD-(D/E)XK nuclease family protein [Desulfurobacterium sp.]
MIFKDIPEFTADKIESGKPYIAVRELSSRLLLEICKIRKKPIIGKVAGTLQELALQLIQKDFLNPGIMTEQERLFIVRDAIRKTGIPHWKSPSYVEIVDNRIRELKEHNIETETLRKCAEKVNGNLSKKLKLTAKILDNYNSLIEKYKKYDIFSLFESAKRKKPEYSEIILFFLPQILPLEVDFLNSINTPITVVTFKDNGSFFSKLSKENLKLVQNWEIIEVEPADIAKNFSFKPEGKIDKVKLTEIAYTTESEGIKIVVSFVKKLLYEGVPPEKIAIAGRNLEGKELLFYEAFREGKIPFFSQYKGIPVSLHPAVKKFLSSVKNDEEKTIKDWCKALKESAEKENIEEEFVKELEILNREIAALTESNIIENNKINGKEFLELLKIIMKNRTFLISEEEPFGVFAGTPENVPSALPTHILFFDFSSGTYPRSFPFDPDFSYQEREEINRILNLNNPILEALPGREKLIMYEFQTFYNILATDPQEMIFTYHIDKGSSTFLSILKTYTNLKKESRKFVSAKAKGLLSIYKDKTNAHTPIEWGIVRWKEKIEGAKEMNFIFDSNFIGKYLPKNLSVTDVISYFDCPTELFFTKIVGYKKTTTVEALEGQIYHEFIRRYFSEGGNPKELFEKVFKEFTQSVDEERIFLHKPFIKYNILKFIADWQPKSNVYKQEIDVEVKIDDITLSGRIDWVEKKDKHIEVIDFKRGNVSTDEYDPGKKKSFQIILYGLSLAREKDVVKAVKNWKYKQINFAFISIPKFNKKSEEKNWLKYFEGKRIRKEIMSSITWVVTGYRMIEKGFFAPLGINPYKPSPKNKEKLFSFRESNMCPYTHTLTQKQLNIYREKVQKMFKRINKKLWG